MQRFTELPPPPGRPAESHKGTFGTVIVVGGSRWMPGAAALAARAAFRSGAGLVRFAAEPAALASMLVIEPSATGIPLPPDPADLTWLEAVDPQRRCVLAIGPGAGLSSETIERVRHLLARADRPLVVDADGLNALAQLMAAGYPLPPAPEGGRVLTPHPGEYHRLALALRLETGPESVEARIRCAMQLSEVLQSTVVLKGAETIVACGTGYYRNTTGNPALATAGSGDVLTGAVAGLMAQGMRARQAAVLGVHVQGLAADHWAHRFGPAGLITRELADGLPGALQEVRVSGKSPAPGDDHVGA